MITHIVVFTWKEGVAGQQVAALAAAMDAVAAAAIPGLRSFRHGSDLRIRPGNGDYALVATFDDEAAWQGYQGHPAHKGLVADFIAPMRERAVAIQIAA